MYPTNADVARQIASNYTRDRIRDAEAARTARAFRKQRRESRSIQIAESPVTPRARRARWFVPARTTTASAQ